MVAFNHLHTHSYYSFLEGLPSPAALVEAAVKDGMRALALTDRNYLTGAVEFYQACQSTGLQPILGLQVTAASPLGPGPAVGDLVLLAQNLSGWKSLCCLSSTILSDPSANPDQTLTFNQLAEQTDGLICLTAGNLGCLDQLVTLDQIGAAASYLAHLIDLFPDRLYVEIQRRTPLEADLSNQIVRIAGKLNIPVVAANPVYYLTNEQAEMQRLVAAIRRNQPVPALPVSAYPPPGSNFTNTDQMRERFSDLPQALSATDEITSRCQLILPLDQPRFPKVSLPAGKSAIETLREKAEQGAVKRYGQINLQIRDRLDYELSVIEGKGYTPLFLIMEEIVGQARLLGIPISSRGSAASSLVAYCLGITSPDPIKLDLFFERFLNPARQSPPDIDTDICSRRRDEVINFVYHRFGDSHVAMVATINRFRRRSALREAAKARGFAPHEIKVLVDQLPHRWRGGPSRRKEPPFAGLIARYPGERFQRLFAEAAGLIGVPRHLSIHPGGIVISPHQMTDLVPVQLASKGVVITQFDLDSVSHLGLVKIDLLGIRGLTVLGDVAEAMRAQNPGQYPSSLDALDAIPEHDPATSDLLQAGRTIGCFQIESPGMRATLKEIQARSVDDLMIALALYRPGPLTGGLKDAFVRRHRGEEQITHLHPALSEILADTYGVILYQEQVLRIAHQLAGLSLADADLLRRAMSHFDPGEQMQTLKRKFIAGAEEKSQMPPDIAEHVWELMAAFAGYGFPKAHAASYAQIAWRAAWSKAHRPAAFMASVLANWGGYYLQPVYLNEARRMGLKLHAPHVNFSQRQFSVSSLDHEQVLFMGLDQVKELTQNTQKRIIAGRPFKSLGDFLVKVDPSPKEADHLIRVGALDGLGEIPALLVAVEQGSWKGGQMSFFNFGTESTEPGKDWSLDEKAAAQKELLGVSVIAHPLELHREKIHAAGALTTSSAAQKLGQRVRVAGLQFTRAQRRTKDGKSIYLLDLEDLDGMLLVVIAEDVYHRHRAAFSRENPFIVEGVIGLEGRFNETAIRAERAWRL
ncbi:MAG: DNA polymerase III subunit alpha [Anaerolineales bacterium]|jgi:DNA-directed DNA polymerase III PolC